MTPPSPARALAVLLAAAGAGLLWVNRVEPDESRVLGAAVLLVAVVALVAREQACGHGRPTAAAEADEFGVHGAEGDEAAPTVRADAVKPFDFEKALLAVVDDARGDGGDVVFAQQREGVVLGQQ